MELKSKLETMKKGTLTLQEYFTKIMNLVDSLIAVGQKISHDNHVMHILASLGVVIWSELSTIYKSTLIELILAIEQTFLDSLFHRFV